MTDKCGAIQQIGRRQFVGQSIGVVLTTTSLLPLLSACASLASHPVTPIDGRVRLALEAYPQLTDPGGSVQLMPVGTDVPVYVLALGDRRFAALSPICTHRGCTVQIRALNLVCPCHGSTYDREGRVVRGPAQRALTRYAVEVQGGDVLIDLSVTS
ncbi:MAG: Rieske (2Fe-2S) protein [Gemmatimonadaceae bacterium]